MTIREGFCPKCGGPSQGGELCSKCRAETTEWLIFREREECVSCPSCGSFKIGNIWTDSEGSDEKLAISKALSAVDIHEDVEDVSLDVSTFEPTPNRTLVTILVSGRLYGMPVEKTCEVLIIWKKEQCDRCCRLSGGYYEGIIQIRAFGRRPENSEKDHVQRIASRIEEELQETGERLSFITKVEETKDGVDIVVSSHHIGEMISRQVVQECDAKLTTHPKLIGERDGKKLYRITYLVRLPHYRKGDVILKDKRYFEVRGHDKGGMRVFDLKTGATNTIPEETEGRFIGNVSEASETLVAFMDGDMAGIMDPDTYVSRLIPAYPWLGLSEGRYVRVLKDHEEDLIFPVG